MTPPSPARELIYVFRHGAPDENLLSILTQLGFDFEPFNDAKDFLLKSKNVPARFCIIDFTTPKKEIPSAILRTVLKHMPKTTPLAYSPESGVEAITALAEGNRIDFLRAPVNRPRLEAAFKAAREPRPAYVSPPPKSAPAPTPQAAADPTPPPDAAGAVGAPATPAAAGPAPAGDARSLVMQPVPPAIQWVFEKLTPVFVELGQNIEFHEDIEKQFKSYADKLSDQKEQIVAMVKKVRNTNEELDLLQSLRALGAGATRNLLATRTLVNATAPGTYSFDSKTGIPSHDPKNVIPFSLKMLDRFAEGSALYKIAFSTGLVFDAILRVLARDVPAGPERTSRQRAAEEFFKEGMARIDAGIKSGKKVEDLVLAHHLVSTILLSQAGRLGMAVVFNDYLDYQRVFNKKAVPRPFRVYVEETVYGLGHNLVGAAIAEAAPNISDAALSVLFCDIPVHLRLQSEHNPSELAAFCRSLP